MSDIASYRDPTFALLWLLGLQLSTRLDDSAEFRFWRIESKADCQLLDGLSRQRGNVPRIEHSSGIKTYMLRVVGLLKMGAVRAPTLGFPSGKAGGRVTRFASGRDQRPYGRRDGVGRGRREKARFLIQDARRVDRAVPPCSN
jgi:Tn3 transposase DDE domain